MKKIKVKKPTKAELIFMSRVFEAIPADWWKINPADFEKAMNIKLRLNKYLGQELVTVGNPIPPSCPKSKKKGGK